MKNDIHHLGQEQQKKKKFSVYVDNQKINKNYSDYTLKKVTKKVAKDLLGSKEKIIFHLEEKGKLGKTYGPYMGSREGEKVEVKTYKMSGGVIGKIQTYNPVSKGNGSQKRWFEEKTGKIYQTPEEQKKINMDEANRKKIQDAVNRQKQGALTSYNQRFATERAANERAAAERAAALATQQAAQASQLTKNVLKNKSNLQANQVSSQLQTAANLVVQAANTAANAVKNAQRTNSLATQEAASNALQITANAVINTANAVVQTANNMARGNILNTPTSQNFRNINISTNPANLQVAAIDTIEQANKVSSISESVKNNTNLSAQNPSLELRNAAHLLMNSAKQAQSLVSAANSTYNQDSQIAAAEAVKAVASATANLANTSIAISYSNAKHMEKNDDTKNLLNEIKSTIETFLSGQNSNKSSLKEIHNKIDAFLHRKNFTLV